MCRREKLATINPVLRCEGTKESLQSILVLISAINSVLVLMVYTEMCRKEGVTAINSYTDICNQLCTGIDGMY